ncbi:MAG TPA: BsuPI-related putative proteinase inhibitor [Longimicrobiales bacterium]
MRALQVLWVAGLCSCGSAGAPGLDVGAGSPEELGASLNVRVMGDSVRLEVHVTNVAGSPVALEFDTTQRYDFEISRAGGERIWRWSDGMMFGQATGREVLQPGGSLRYVASWSGRGQEGDFVATARVVSDNYPVELRTGFRLPE